MSSEHMNASPASINFVGRQRELTELRSALEQSISGRGQLVMVFGDAGIGKTRMVQELAVGAEAQGVRVLWGRCYDGEGAPPYWPWVQALNALLGRSDPQELRADLGAGASDVSELLPDLRDILPNLEPPPTLEPERARFRLFNSVTTFLRNISRRVPLVVVLDDLHWADRSSLMLLQFLSQQLGDSSLMVVGTYRDVEVNPQHPLSDTLASLSREQAFHRQSLVGLGFEDTQDFIEVASGIRPSRELVESVYLRTEGNPFYLGEIVRFLQARQGSKTEIEVYEDSNLPEGVRSVIQQRLGRLSNQCYQILTTAAFIGQYFDFGLLDQVSRTASEDRLLDAIDEALEAHVIQIAPEGEERYRFSHVLIQHVLVQGISPSRKVRMHARVGEAMEDHYARQGAGSAAQLAYHFAVARGIVGPSKVVHYSLLAGQQALSTHAYEEALPHFEQGLTAKGVALEGTEPARDSETADLLFGLGRCHAVRLDSSPQAGRRMTDAWNRAFDYYVSTGNKESALAIALHPTSPGRYVLAGLVDIVERALMLSERDSLDSGWLLYRHGIILERVQGDYQGSQEAFGRALTIARREEDVSLEMRILANAAEADFFHLMYQDSLNKSSRVLEISDGVDDLRTRATASFYAARSLDSIGDHSGARRHAAAILTAAEDLKEHWWIGSACWFNSMLSCLEGDWHTARELGSRGLKATFSNPRILGNLALLEYEVGDFDQGQEFLKQLLEAMRRFAPGPITHYSIPALVLPMIARLTGINDQLDIAESAAKTILESPTALPFEIVAVRNGLAIKSVIMNDPTGAGAQYKALEPHRGTVPKYVFEPSIDRVLGLLSATMGDLGNAVIHFEEAQAFSRGAGYLPELAWSCYDHANCLIRLGTAEHKPIASNLLGEAAIIAKDLGMRPLLEGIASSNESLMSSLVAKAVYPQGLSPREIDVLQLVALGKTDREIAEELFISVKTVGFHVGNILNKTTCINRTEAATFAAQHDLIP